MTQSQTTDLFAAIAEGRYGDQRQQDSLYTPATSPLPNYSKVVILDVIHDPRMITQEFEAYLRHQLGVSNIKFLNVLPRNTIVGRKILSEGSSVEPPMFYLPFLPSHIGMPAKPGEIVWVFYDSPGSKNTDVGWWLWRVVTFDHTDDPNHSHQPRDFDPDFFKSDSSKSLSEGDVEPTYDFFNGIGNKDSSGVRFNTADSRVISGQQNAFENILTGSYAGRLVQPEAVPRYKKRPSDLAFEGSNNQVIAFTTDRLSSAYESIPDVTGEPSVKLPTDDVKGAGSGGIEIVVGRGQTPDTQGKVVTNTLDREELGKSASEVVESEGDFDYKADRSRIAILSRSKIDEKLGTDIFNEKFLSKTSEIIDRGADLTNPTTSTSGDGAIAIKSDKIRLVSRSDLVIYCTTFTEDKNGRLVEVDDIEKWSAIAFKPNGDIVIKPSSTGAILLGGDDADKGVFVSDVPCTLNRNSGAVTGAPVISTMGGAMITGTKGQGKWANRILIKS
jgi:hypothetical protein